MKNILRFFINSLDIILVLFQSLERETRDQMPTDNCKIWHLKLAILVHNVGDVVY